MTEIKTALRAGDIVSYRPVENHCYEGTAEVVEWSDGTLVMLDTYWLSDRAPVKPDEYQVLFNRTDFDRAANRSSWERYAKADRAVVSHQHGLQYDWYVRKGAAESLAQQIENATEKVRQAEDELAFAHKRVEWAKRDLAALEGTSA